MKMDFSQDIKVVRLMIRFKNDYYPSDENHVEKIPDEPFAYLVGNLKIYVFDNPNFFDWYVEKHPKEFLMTIIGKNKAKDFRKYLKQFIPNIMQMCPAFEKDIFTKMDEVFQLAGLDNISMYGQYTPQIFGLRIRKNIALMIAV
jgi:hypothetical protein